MVFFIYLSGGRAGSEERPVVMRKDGAFARVYLARVDRFLWAGRKGAEGRETPPSNWLDVAGLLHGYGGALARCSISFLIQSSGIGPELSLPPHFGHFVMSRPVRRRIRSAVVSFGSFSGGSGGGCMPSEVRMVLRACFLLPLERNPKLRIFIKLGGRMCRVNRRRNSEASRATEYVLSFLRFLAVKVTLPSLIFVMR